MRDHLEPVEQPKWTTLTLAIDYLNRGICIFPGIHKDKKPAGAWSKETVTQKNVKNYFPGAANILWINGSKSGNLADIDLDSIESRLIAHRYLPETPIIFGRRSSPASHFVYRTHKPLKRIPLTAPGEADTERDHGAMIVELRGEGTYTMAPGSMHPSGERVRFYAVNGEQVNLDFPGPIPVVDGDDLALRVRKLAAAALVARLVQEGERNTLHMNLAGALLHQGMAPEDVRYFCESIAIASRDEELENRISTVESTIEKFKSDGEVTGVPTLIAQIGQETVDRLLGWLALPGHVGRGGKQRVHIDGDLEETIRDMAAAIHKANDPPTLFRQGSAIVQIEIGARTEVWPLDVDRLRLVVARSMTCVASQKRGNDFVDAPKHPNHDILATLLKSPELRSYLPELDGLSCSPVLTPTGEVQIKRGYDPRTRMILTTDAFKSLDLTPPDKENVRAAIQYIDDELLVDFPFDSDASRANAYAVLLTGLIRPCLSETSPLFLLDAPTRGSGKSFLATAVAMLASDHFALKPWPSFNEEEREKVFNSLLRANYTHIILDNVSYKVVSSSLDSILTSKTPVGRLLGSTTIQTFVNNAVWMMTANNAELGGDLASRSVLIKLDAQAERPEERTFKHTDLLAFVKTERVTLLTSVLTLVRHWIAEGKPAYSGTERHRMAGWCSMVGGILETAGIHGFLENMDQLLEEADAEHEDLTLFIRLWHDKYKTDPRFAKDLADLAYNGDPVEDISGPLWSEDVDHMKDEGKAKRISHFLKKHRNRVISGYKIVRIEDKKHGHRFRLEPVDDELL